jgi:hypothetical protein
VLVVCPASNCGGGKGAGESRSHLQSLDYLIIVALSFRSPRINHPTPYATKLWIHRSIIVTINYLIALQLARRVPTSKLSANLPCQPNLDFTPIGAHSRYLYSSHLTSLTQQVETTAMTVSDTLKEAVGLGGHGGHTAAAARTSCSAPPRQRRRCKLILIDMVSQPQPAKRCPMPNSHSHTGTRAPICLYR